MPRHVVVSKIEQDKLVVTQANRLIEASYTMTLEEKRIVLLMVSLVRKAAAGLSDEMPADDGAPRPAPPKPDKVDFI
jgi:hypothetical protein